MIHYCVLTVYNILYKIDLTCFCNANRAPIKLEELGEYILDITDNLQATLLHSAICPLIVQYSVTNLRSSYVLSDLHSNCYSCIIQTLLQSSLSLLCHSAEQPPYKFILFCGSSLLLLSILDNGGSLMKFSIL